MAMYIGSNNRETLLGVIEELEREIRPRRIALSKIEARLEDPLLKTGKQRLRSDKAATQAVINMLQSLINTFTMASQNGPTPTEEQLRGLRLGLTQESRERLAAAVSRGAANRTADDIANDLLKDVNLTDLLTPAQQFRMDHEEGAHAGTGQSIAGCPLCLRPIGIGKTVVVDSSSGDEGMNTVDPTVSCTFCGVDLDAEGNCSAAIDELCAVGETAVSALEETVQDLGRRAGIRASVTEGKDSWFVLFDGMQIGSHRTKVTALTSALERLSVRVRGMLHGSPTTTFGLCIPACSSAGIKGPRVVYFNGDTWQCRKHQVGKVTGV